MSHIDHISTDKDSIYQLLMRLDAFNFLQLTPFDDLKLLAHFINNTLHSTHTIAHLALEKRARKFKEDKGFRMMGITNLFLHPRGSWKNRVNFLGKKWFLWAAVLISLFGYIVPTQAQQNLAQQQINYDVWRNGKIIGSYVLAFNPQGKQLRVTVDWNIKINGMIFTLYRSEHHSEEIWEGKQLISLISASNDNGKRRQFSLRQNNKTAEIVFDDHTITTTLGLFPTSLWQSDTIKQTVLLDTVKGKLRQVNIEYQGTENIMIGGHSLPTKHYLISGEMTRHVWYGMDQDIVQVSFPASDGSMIIIRKRLP